MKKIIFSFIIPTLNEENYIEDCLLSIKSQARKDYEIIVVDSYSTDRTVAIARRHGARLAFEGTKGPGAARNKGARLAKGDILVFIDADVRLKEDFLDMAEKKLGRNIGGFICRLYPFDGYYTPYLFTHVIMKFIHRIGIAMTAGSCFVYRKDVFEKAGGFNPLLLTNEDHDLAIKVSKLNRVLYFDDINVMTSSRRLRRKGLIKTMKIYFKSTLVYFFNKGYVRGYWD